MIISVWRYSHLALAVSSFLFLTLAAVSGIFLAFDPLVEQARPYKVKGVESVTLAETLPVLKEKFHGIQQLSVDDHDFVTIRWTNEAGKDQLSYVNPITGAILGAPAPRHPFFQWMTNFHRSLFLHETGRLIVGITSLLLVLIVLSGIGLIAKRQEGLLRFFKPVERASFAQYYHVVFGRVFLFFILAIALSGTYLSFARYLTPPAKASTLVNEANLRDEPVIKPAVFPVFRQTTLAQVQTVDFPFSDFPEDYYTLTLRDKQLCVNQFNGDILAQQVYSKAYTLNQFSMRWHTGRSNAVWAVVLLVSSGYILFFIASGFMITWKRLSGRSKNKFKPADSEIILLVGSENGSTFRFASAIHKQLLKHGQKSYLTDLNNYTTFPRAKHLVVMTSTYGLGDPPANARRFAEKLAKFPQQQPVPFSVVGFGSRSYAQFCKFAFDVQSLLKHQPWARPLMDVVTVSEQSPQDFSGWLSAWQQITGYPLIMPRELLASDRPNLEKLVVVEKTPSAADDTFLLRLKPGRRSRFRSGDLVAFYPKNDHRERLYSIGKVEGALQLSVRLHEHGLGSQFLGALQAGEKIRGRIIKNEHFHFPRRAPGVIMISNGTGIAPFLGMISENWKNIPCHLYCGFRTASSFDLHKPLLSEAANSGKLSACHVAFSREGEKQYVSDLIRRDIAFVKGVLDEGGVLMICGSLSMQKDVFTLLDELTGSGEEGGLDAYVENGQVLTDCY